jgi:hypothetical protein
VRARVCVATQLKERAQLDTERTERTVMHERAALEREQRLLQVEEQVSTPLRHAACHWPRIRLRHARRVFLSVGRAFVSWVGPGR